MLSVVYVSMGVFVLMFLCVSDSDSVDAVKADAICGASVLLIASDSSGVMYASRRSSFCWMAAFCVGNVGDAFCAVSVCSEDEKAIQSIANEHTRGCVGLYRG